MTHSTSNWGVDEGRIHIGLVNNMPDSSLEATERQFRTLLSEAAEGIPLQLSCYAIPAIRRSEKARSRISSSYESIDELWNRRLDGLIVTGAEPAAANLTDEPFWKSLTQLMEWADGNTHSSVWSCLAAHAAVLHQDGIRRLPFRNKYSGVFECAKTSDHVMTAGLPSCFRTPHSRWNTIPLDALNARGYRLLTQLNDGGADIFLKQRNSVFLFCQGHLEYEAVSLLLEYRRDIRRFLSHETDCYPSVPQGYFDEEEVASLIRLQARAVANRCPESFAEFPALNVRCAWRVEAVRFYRNWLQYLAEQNKKELQYRIASTEYPFKSAVAAAGLGNQAHIAEAG
jgi:homoserine O-succinyltransferase